MSFVYILRCSDNSLYTGYTTDVKRRLAEHNRGQASKYTRGRRPVKCVYVEEMASKSEALKRELEIKKMSKSCKEELIKQSSSYFSDLL